MKSDRTTIQTALEAVRRGFTPLPLQPGQKKPVGAAWTRTNWHAAADDADKPIAALIEESFDDEGNIGLLLGEHGGRLIDIDLDHPRTARLRDYFLPDTPMKSGRAGRPSSHYWYIAEPGTLQTTRQHKMPDGAMCVEYRSTGAQSVIPPSVHPSGEDYLWVGEAFGGYHGPAVVNGKVLAVQVALLALGTVLVDAWPHQGSRHEAYLALAGGLLRYGDSIHPYWEKNASVLIRALAYATLDDDGPDAREKEVMGTTLKRLRAGEMTTGFGKLSEIIGSDAVKQVRYLLGEVESAAGLQPRTAQAPTSSAMSGLDYEQAMSAHESEIASMPDADRDPLAERISSWQPVDLGPYLSGQILPVEPTIFEREDGAFLMYPGRINMLYGSSESAKSWLALHIAMQEIGVGARVVYCDFEDEPVNTLDRLRRMGAAPDDLSQGQFTYVRPEEPIADMQRGRGGDRSSSGGTSAADIFERLILGVKEDGGYSGGVDPTLIVIDGLSVLYGLHGLDTDKVMDTDIITNWLKSLTRNGRTTVLVIDHTGKTPEKGSLPIGSQHKVSMVQGTLLQAWVKTQPMPGIVGVVELVVLKDRPGQVRKVSARPSTTGTGKAQVTAVVRLDSREDEVTKITVEAPIMSITTDGDIVTMSFEQTKEAAKAERATKWSQRVLFVFGGETGKRLSAKQIFDALPNDTKANAHAKAAIQRLEDEGWLLRTNKDGVPSPHQTNGALYELMIGDAGYGVDDPDAVPAADDEADDTE